MTHVSKIEKRVVDPCSRLAHCFVTALQVRIAFKRLLCTSFTDELDGNLGAAALRVMKPPLRAMLIKSNVEPLRNRINESGCRLPHEVMPMLGCLIAGVQRSVRDQELRTSIGQTGDEGGRGINTRLFEWQQMSF